MKFRKPQVFPILFIIGATLLLGGLGAWQVERLQWKNGILAQIEEAQKAEPLKTLPKTTEEAMYHRVKLTGRFVGDAHFYLIAQPRASQPGFSVLAPLKLEKDGRVVLVNRGWAPKGKESLPKGVQKIEGVVRPLREKRYFAPENQIDKNLWFYEDTAAMGQAAKVELLPYVVEQVGPAPKDSFPIPGDGKIAMRNDHLSYAITWFSLAFAGIIMFVLYHREKPYEDLY